MDYKQVAKAAVRKSAADGSDKINTIATIAARNNGRSGRMPSIKLPLYDEGGDVSIAVSRRAQAAGDENIQSIMNSEDEQPYVAPAQAKKQSATTTDTSNPADRLTTDRSIDVRTPSHMPGGGPAESAPLIKYDSSALPSTPVYDRGGSVNVQDGHHELALLEDGERVLNPQETRSYEKNHPHKGPTHMSTEYKSIADIVSPEVLSKIPGTSQYKNRMPRIGVFDEGGDVDSKGVPANFPGIVLPNPDNIQPVASESIQPRVDEPTRDAKFILASEQTPTEKDRAAQTVRNPGAQTTSSDVDTLIPERDTKEEKPTLSQGMANAWLKRIGAPETTTSDVSGQVEERPTGLAKIKTPASAVVPAETLAMVPGTPQNRYQEKAGGPLLAGTPSTETPSEQRDLAQMKYKAQLADYDQRIQAAKDLATPEGQEQADRLTAAKLSFQKASPWGSEANHPGILGKIGHYAAEVGNVAGNVLAPGLLAPIPGTELNNRIKQIALTEAMAKDTQLNTQRQAEENAADKNANKVVKSPWEPVAGEQFTHYDASGAPVQQLYRNTQTGEQSWRAVPSAEGAAPAQTAGAPAAGGAPAGGYYGDKQQPKFAEKPVGQEGTKQYTEQLKATALRVPKGYDVAQPEILATDTNATAAEKIKEYNTSVNNAILADRSDKAQAARETAKESAERRAEERADRKQIGYAQDADGNTILTNKYDAGLNGQSFEPATPGDISKDRNAVRMLNDVQINVSRYTKAANNYDAAHLSEDQQKKDADNMAYFLNKSGFYDLDLAIAEGGHINVGMVTAASEKASTLKRSEQYKALSPQAKELLDGYIRTMSAVPAYQKSLTNIGRSNKEMLDLEQANIANPTMGTTEILRKQAQFQENVDQAASGFPKLPGLKTHSEVKADTESTKKPELPPVPKEVPNNASHIYRDSKGNVKGYALNGQYHAVGD